MSKIIDLTGRKFKRLLVQCDSDKRDTNGQIIWRCLCDCGNECDVTSGNLRRGQVSCGCYAHEKASERIKNSTNKKWKSLVNLEGKRFGRLTVKYDTGKRGKENGQVIWRCICDCGTECDVASGNLKHGQISCGCYRLEKVAEEVIDLTNQRFGKLIANYDTKKRYRRGAIWNCTCDCGNNIDVPSDRLQRGTTKSCGCLSESFTAYNLKAYFRKNYSAETEYKILKNPTTNRWLPYDIYIPQGENPKVNGIYIEVNGNQHYDETDRIHIMHSIKSGKTPLEEFEKQLYRDKLKKEFAKSNGIYIEIDIKTIKTISGVLDYLFANQISLIQ